MHTMHTFYFFFYNPLYSKGFRGVEGMHQVMHTARIPMHTTGFSPVSVKKNGPSPGVDRGRMPHGNGEDAPASDPHERRPAMGWLLGGFALGFVAVGAMLGGIWLLGMIIGVIMGLFR